VSRFLSLLHAGTGQRLNILVAASQAFLQKGGGYQMPMEVSSLAEGFVQRWQGFGIWAGKSSVASPLGSGFVYSKPRLARESVRCC